jgi:hypothetical protein
MTVEYQPETVASALPVAQSMQASIHSPAPPPVSRWPNWLTTFSLIATAVLAVLYLGAMNRAVQLEKQRGLVFKTIEWAVNQAQEFPYGEPPFGGDRLPLLQELVQQLNAAGFHGKIRLESHIGEFCLLRQSAADGSNAAWIPAPPELPLTDCGALGQSTEQSQALSAAQSAGFKRFLNELPDGIQIELVPLGAAEPKWDYPGDPTVRAGEWNRVAQRNQRVQVVLVPTTGM